MSTSARIADLLAGGRQHKAEASEKAKAKEASTKEARDRTARSRQLEGLTGHRGSPASRAPDEPARQQSSSSSLRSDIEDAWGDYDGR
jgi:hypothetical protein